MANFNLSLVLVSFVVAITISLASGNTILADKGRGNISELNGIILPQSVFFIGTVNGKSFFGDKTEKTWAQANAYCEGINMRLASILTQPEQNILNNAYSSTFSGYFWTSGRDARRLRQFSWSDGTQPIDFYSSNFGVSGSDGRCLAYYSRASDSYLYSFPCTTNRSVICDSG